MASKSIWRIGLTEGGKMHKVLVMIGLMIAVSSISGMQIHEGRQIMGDTSKVAVRDLTITVVYDNYPYREGLRTSWGFACVVRGTEKTILFDTGGDASILLSNMDKLGIDPRDIDVIVLSHIHGDHVGGLHGFLESNPHVTVYLPKSFTKSFKDGVKAYGVEVVEVHEPTRICTAVYSTGELGTWIKEQSLVIRTDKGLVVITGCAHPGIVNIVTKARELLDDNILLVMGGFHLLDKSRAEIEKIINSFKQLGVQYVGACHCSGDTARRMFASEYKERFINIGVGKAITAKDLAF